jgi:drug/metabolite transporter (DMT)-like permease
MQHAPSPRIAAIAFVTLCLIWGTTWFFIRWGLDGITPLCAAAVRLLLSWVLMCAVVRWLGKREGGAAPSLALSVGMGVFNCGGSYAVLYVAEEFLPSGLVSVIWAVYPLMVALGGHWFLEGERLDLQRSLGFLLGLAGVTMLFATDVLALGQAQLGMAFFLLLSPLISTVGTLLVKRHGAQVSSLQLNRNGMLVGAILLSLLAFALEEPMTMSLGWRACIAIAYLACFGTVLAFGVWFWMLRHRPASELAVISYVTPMIALGVGAAFGAEHVGWSTLSGAALILVGVALSRRRAL